MACAVCGKGTGFFGGNFAFTCPVCKKDICQDCARRFSDAKSSGGIFGDKHLELTCPNCHSTIRPR
jgi:rubrerythrin